MAELQCLDKPDWLKNCIQIADHFVNTIEQTSKEGRTRFAWFSAGITYLFRWKKQQERRGKEARTLSSIESQIPLTFQTFECWRSFCHTLKRRGNSLSFSQTRQWSMYFRRQSGRRFVRVWGSECKATHKDLQYLRSNQEEADTKVILHAVDATSDGAVDIQVHPPRHWCVCSCFKTVPRFVRQSCFFRHSKRAHA